MQLIGKQNIAKNCFLIFFTAIFQEFSEFLITVTCCHKLHVARKMNSFKSNFDLVCTTLTHSTHNAAAPASYNAAATLASIASNLLTPSKKRMSNLRKRSQTLVSPYEGSCSCWTGMSNLWKNCFILVSPYENSQ